MFSPRFVTGLALGTWIFTGIVSCFCYPLGLSPSAMVDRAKKHLIYALVNMKDKKYFYVGQSRTYLNRPYSHLERSSVPAVRSVIDSIGAQNVDIFVLEELDGPDGLYLSEMTWIGDLLGKGHPLVNVSGSQYADPENVPKRRVHKDKARTLVGAFVCSKRRGLGYTQEEFSKRVGVGLRFLKDLELGKETCRMDKVNQVLGFLGYSLGPVRLTADNLP